MTPKWLIWEQTTPPSFQSNWSDYMSANSGVGYWIVPAGTGATSQINGPTGGDSSTTWTKIRFNTNASYGTTQSGNTITQPVLEWRRGLQGSHQSYSNPYDYCAIGWQAAGSSSFGQANGAGWVICEREQTAGTQTSSRQSFIPIEGTDGLTAVTYAGGAPKWNDAGLTDHIVFFFNNYSTGDVGSWTTWDGTTTP